MEKGSPRRKAKPRKRSSSRSHSRSKRESRKQPSKETKIHSKYESPFQVQDLIFSSELAGTMLSRQVIKEVPRAIDIDNIKPRAKRQNLGETTSLSIDPHVEAQIKELVMQEG